jgi:hypothetical protein
MPRRSRGFRHGLGLDDRKAAGWSNTITTNIVMVLRSATPYYHPRDERFIGDPSRAGSSDAHLGAVGKGALRSPVASVEEERR